MPFRNMKLNLGIPELLPAWKNFFSRQFFLEDLYAGITVAFVAIPLSLAIALASGVPPEVGLITAIIAGVVCALFGGTPLAVCGPAAAMCILIADVVEKFGVHSLILIGALAGLMQLVSGILGLGRLGRYVPLPVIAGFTAGIGVIILIGQLPRAFGLMPPPESDIFSVFSHLKSYLHEINGTCILLVAVTIAIIRGLPKVLPRLPAILIAVTTVSAITYFFDLADVPLIGAIPHTLPAPALPKFTDISIQDLILNAFFIYLLASLETLLSSSAIDKMTKGKKHDANQELVGQGMANIASAMFGGIPVTGVIARSATNVRAGAKTRRSSIIHSIIILLAIYIAAPLISLIPIAALAGVLFSVAFSMISFREFYDLWTTAKSEAMVYVITFFTIVFFDLLAGVQAGLIAACVIILLRATKTHLHVSINAEDDIVRLSLEGALTFLSTPQISELQNKIDAENRNSTIVMDLTNVRNLDMSGAAAIVDFFNHCQNQKIPFFIKGLPRRFESLFEISGGSALLNEFYLVSEHQLRNKQLSVLTKSSYGRLKHGVQKSYIQRQHNDKRLFQYIADKQDPHTLFITCSDSRIDPAGITSSDPGELFIVRNIGNFIPPYANRAEHSEAAAIDFAINTFDITDIVVCGHTNCGAMKACQFDHSDFTSPELEKWVSNIKAQLINPKNHEISELARMNLINQLDNLKHYPQVHDKLINNKITLHAWYYDVEQSIIYEWNSEVREFVSLVVTAQTTHKEIVSGLAAEIA